jgi:hypothetical protein
MEPKRIALLAAVALLAPATAHAADFSIEALYGIAFPPAADFESAVEDVDDDDLSEDSAQIVGGTLLLSFGLLEVGAILDATIPDRGPDQTAIGALGGIRLGEKFRVDLLGEIGGQRYGNVFEDSDVVTDSTEEQWLLYVGLRPGIAYRFGAEDGIGVVLGVWGFVQVSAGDETQGDVELGGTTLGATLRAGIEF